MHVLYPEASGQAGGLFFRIEIILMFQLEFDIITIVEKCFGRQWLIQRGFSNLIFKL
jgi:hypothetical protein